MSKKRRKRKKGLTISLYWCYSKKATVWSREKPRCPAVGEASRGVAEEAIA